MKTKAMISYQGLAGLKSKVNPLLEMGSTYTLEVCGSCPEWEEHLKQQCPINVTVVHNQALSENVAILYKEVKA